MTCPECGKTMRFETRHDSIVFQGQSHKAQTTGWWCDSCDEAIFEGDALLAREVTLKSLVSERDR